MKFLNRVLAVAVLLLGINPVAANWLYTPGAGPSAFVSFNSGTTPAGTGLCAASNTDCLANIPIDLSGAQLFTTTNNGYVRQGNGPWTSNVTQWGGNNVVTGGANGSIGVGGQAAVAANPVGNPLYLGQFDGTNMRRVMGDETNGLWVNVKAGGGTGGTSSNFGSAFPTPGTAIGLTNGTNMVPWSATTNYGTAPAAIAVPAVNSFVTNGVSLGQNTPGLSVPNVLALGQACNGHVAGTISSATDTLLVQGVTSQTIRVCGWKVSFAGTATAFLENTASVNANCSSTLTKIAGKDTGAVNNAFGFYGLYQGLSNTVSNGLCVNSTGTGGFDYDLWYWQG